MSAPPGYDPGVSLLQDVPGQITPAMGGGGMVGGAPSLFGKLFTRIQEAVATDAKILDTLTFTQVENLKITSKKSVADSGTKRPIQLPTKTKRNADTVKTQRGRIASSKQMVANTARRAWSGDLFRSKTNPNGYFPTYFQKQESAGCGRHALNNLLTQTYFHKTGGTRFTGKEPLPLDATPVYMPGVCWYLDTLFPDTAAKKLDAKYNPCPPEEDYDITVLQLALYIYGYDHTLVDLNKKPTADEPNTLGYIINSGTHIKFKHWTALRKIPPGYQYAGQFQYIDSVSVTGKDPQLYASLEDCLTKKGITSNAVMRVHEYTDNVNLQNFINKKISPGLRGDKKQEGEDKQATIDKESIITMLTKIEGIHNPSPVYTALVNIINANVDREDAFIQLRQFLTNSTIQTSLRYCEGQIIRISNGYETQAAFLFLLHKIIFNSTTANPAALDSYSDFINKTMVDISLLGSFYIGLDETKRLLLDDALAGLSRSDVIAIIAHNREPIKTLSNGSFIGTSDTSEFDFTNKDRFNIFYKLLNPAFSTLTDEQIESKGAQFLANKRAKEAAKSTTSGSTASVAPANAAAAAKAAQPASSTAAAASSTLHLPSTNRPLFSKVPSAVLADPNATSSTAASPSVKKHKVRNFFSSIFSRTPTTAASSTAAKAAVAASSTAASPSVKKHKVRNFFSSIFSRTPTTAASSTAGLSSAAQSTSSSTPHLRATMRRNRRGHSSSRSSGSLPVRGSVQVARRNKGSTPTGR